MNGTTAESKEAGSNEAGQRSSRTRASPSSARMRQTRSSSRPSSPTKRSRTAVRSRPSGPRYPESEILIPVWNPARYGAALLRIAAASRKASSSRPEASPSLRSPSNDGRVVQTSPYGRPQYDAPRFVVKGTKVYEADKFGREKQQAYEIKPKPQSGPRR